MTGQRAAPRFCHKCGAEIPPGSSYCRVCGYSNGRNSVDSPGNAKGEGK